MGSSYSKGLSDETDQKIEHLSDNSVTATLVPPSQPEITHNVTSDIVRLTLEEKLSVDDLFKIQMAATNRLHSELLEKKDSIEFDYASRLICLSKGNTEQAVDILKRVTEQIGVPKSSIKPADIRRPNYTKKQCTVSFLESMISKTLPLITFKNVLQTYTFFRFGASPYLIHQTYVYSGLGILGIASGVTCLGLSVRFLYIHPEILSFLKIFSDYSSVSPENLDIFIFFVALKQLLVEGISLLVKNGLFASIRYDYKLLAPVLGAVIQSYNYVDVFNSFVNYLTIAISTAKEAVTRGLGKTYQFIVNTEYRKDRLETIESLGSSSLSYFTSSTNEVVLEKDTVREQLDLPEREKELSFTEPGMIPLYQDPHQQISGETLPQLPI
jgi:hypothetical protein